MKKTVYSLILEVILLSTLFLGCLGGNQTTSTYKTAEENTAIGNVSDNMHQLIPSYVGYAHVYLNEPITLTFYWCYPKENLDSSTNVVVSFSRFHEIYNYERLKSINRTLLGYIPLSITMNFSRPNYQYNFGVYAKTTLLVGGTEVNESSVFVDLTIQIANITSEDVPIEFGHYNPEEVSFTKDKEVVVYAVEIRNPTEQPVEILNVSYVNTVIIPQYNISVLNFGILSASDASQVPTTPPKNLKRVLLPHEKGILVAYIYLDKDIQALYFKPKITLCIGEKDMIISGPPFSYIRITEPCSANP
ncbi:hypothetical protein NF865_08965 [Thermococcus aggregans]|uniref:Uncharacterized protein n=1 Tax=Thermococcus aggregans TaxID=110163 RepID=A0A9E7MX01_THEAG|nr:hypothetical protein [Thermococcus aggregans]USS40425.1 hypothetical protein NF865_08965 [Thermococcus aggregans]